MIQTILYWFFSVLPVLVLVYTMTSLHWSAAKSAPITALVSFVFATCIFRLPFSQALASVGKGIWSSLTIILIVWPAVFIYEVSEKVGAYKKIKSGFESYCKHELLQILMFAWLFPSFMQGITGYGVAVAIGAPLLLSIGVTPIFSLVFTLLCHCWGGTFGTLALAWNGLINSSGISGSLINSSAFFAAVFIWIFNLCAPISVCWMYGKGKAVKEGLPAILILSLIQGGGQLLLVNKSTDISCFFPSCIALLSVFLLAKMPIYNKKWSIENSPVMKSERNIHTFESSEISFFQSCVPYLMLVLLAVICLVIKPVNSFLSKWKISIAFSATETQLGFKTAAEPFCSPISPLTYAGTLLAVSALAAVLLYRKKNYLQSKEIIQLLKNTAKKAIPSSFATLSMIVLAKLMTAGGMIYVMSSGVASFFGSLYLTISPLIGLLGSFVTGSNLASNILFSGFQKTTSDLLNINSALVLGMQTAGAAMGISMSPSNIVLGCSTVGCKGQEGTVLKTVAIIPLFICLSFGIIVYSLKII